MDDEGYCNCDWCVEPWLDKMCKAHHQVRTEDGFTTAAWDKLRERNRMQYRRAMRAAMVTRENM